MKYRLSYLLLFLSLVSAAQTNAVLSMHGIGGEDRDQIFPYRSVQTYDGGFIVTISTYSTTGNINTTCSNDSPRYVFNKYNADASILEWQKCGAATLDSSFRYLFPLPDGNFILGGSSFSNTSKDFLIRKEDANGNIVWGSKLYGGSAGEVLEDMIATFDGGYVMLGKSNSDDGDVGMHHGGPFNSDFWAIKLDSNGNKVWSTVIGGSDEDIPFTVVAIPSGGYYLAGITVSSDGDCTNFHGDQDLLVARLDDSGHKVWVKCFGGSQEDGFSGYGCACLNNNDGLVITGGSNSGDGDSHHHINGNDIWIVNIDSSGNIIWENSYGGNGNEVSYSIAKSGSNYWVAGSTTSNDGQVGVNFGSGDAWVFHIDSSGNFLSGKVLGENNDDAAYIVQALPGDIAFAGGTYEGPGQAGQDMPATFLGVSDVFLARIAPWTTSIGVEQTATNVDVYPNPATEKITVRLAGDGNKMNSLAIFDMYGRRITQYALANSSTLQVDVSNWPKGIYFLRLANDDGDEHTTKVAVQ